jgi:hypothetical protein
MAGELTCEGKHILLKPFGEDYLLHQRLEAPVLSPRASAYYTPVQVGVHVRNACETYTNFVPTTLAGLGEQSDAQELSQYR